MSYSDESAGTEDFIYHKNGIVLVYQGREEFIWIVGTGQNLDDLIYLLEDRFV
jgi:hypothetical protein